ncbi:MAG: hypothetical protein M1829_002735 [Trizodia sp. TS-e1964]|nr:MAG: hypothetical protein M1829_002735 [Trizodia sp. TS-e1964]
MASQASDAASPGPQLVIAQAAAAVAGNTPDGAAPDSTAGAGARQEPPGEQPVDVGGAGNGRVPSAPRRSGSERVSVDTLIEDAPPAYSGSDDGRVNINITQKNRRLSQLLAPALRSQFQTPAEQEPAGPPPAYIPPSLGGEPGQAPPPPMNVVIQVIGSRGDVQPFVALGKVLKEKYGHRVRLATHPTFKGFVEDNGLEFFSIGGDPAELMAFMVKNPGLMPGIESLRAGDVGKRRKGIYEILKGCWRSCVEAGDGISSTPFDDFVDESASIDSSISFGGNSGAKPFIADAVIANPPSFAHIHVAEKLGIPLHLMFTMPWSPTQSFPHPLANVQSSNADTSMTNFLSYVLVEMMTWQGLGDVINRFREKSLGLEPISLVSAPGMATRLRIPYTYCWSPALIPKPKDWGSHISISGFYFLSLASSFTPEPALADFLAAGPPPVYIGFGSIVVDDPNAMTKMVFEAVKKTGSRALVSKGWGGLGGDELEIPENVFMLGNVPHDWLFKHVSCVVHHGGAGTTAAGIALGRPTVIVPFFGDQPFWGAMVARAGAGPKPIPYKNHTAETLAASILEALEPAALDKAGELGALIAKENGADEGARSFHYTLELDKLRCSLAPSRVAVWRIRRSDVRLSAFAATVLGNEGLLDFNDLKLYRPREYEVDDGPLEPITGATSALVGTIAGLMMGVADFPVELIKAVSSKTEDTEAKDAEKNNHEKIAGNSSQPPTPSSSKSKVCSIILPHRRNTNGSASDLPAENNAPEEVDGLPEDSQSEKVLQEEPLPLHTDAASSENGLAHVSSAPLSHTNSISQVVTAHISRVNSDDASRRSFTSQSTGSKHLSETPVTFETALGAGKGVGRIVQTSLKSPMDFTLALARGFHNAPKLYGDTTVRQADKVTDLQSGLKTAGKEFGLGLYDGISGLLTQPIKGAKEEGPSGLIKGIAKGIGGFLLKPSAAMLSLPGYTFKGIYKEITKHYGSSVQNYIIAVRTAQGYEDWRVSSEEERHNVISHWQEHKLKRKQVLKAEEDRYPVGFLQTRHMTFDERRQLALEKEEKKKQKKEQEKKDREAHKASISRLFSLAGHELHHMRSFPQTHKDSLGHASLDSDHTIHMELEQAIKTSIAATSNGNDAEDRLIERAIRASVIELQSAKAAQAGDDEAYERAIHASINEAHRESEENSTGPLHERTGLERSLQESLLAYHLGGGKSQILDHDEIDPIPEHLADQYDERVLQKALKESKKTIAAGANNGENEAMLLRALEESKKHSEVDAADESHEAMLMRAMEESKKHAELESINKNHDAELQRAIEESAKAHSAHEKQRQQERSEEEIVMEYIKKQSLAEEEHRKSVVQSGLGETTPLPTSEVAPVKKTLAELDAALAKPANPQPAIAAQADQAPTTELAASPVSTPQPSSTTTSNAETSNENKKLD